MRGSAAALLVVAAVVLSACGTTQSPASAVRSWASANQLGTAAADLLDDSARVLGAIHAHGGSQVVLTACDEALSDALGINGDLLPTPDAQLTDLLSAAVDRFANMAARCAAHASSAAVLASVAHERTGALGLLQEAILREEAVTGTTLVVKGPT